MLEPCEAKLSRTVLRGEEGRKPLALPGTQPMKKEVNMLRKVCMFALFVLTVLPTFLLLDHGAAAAEDSIFMPTMAPDAGPPPYEYKDGWTLAIMFKTTPEVLKDLVPKPLVPNTGNLMWVLISRFPDPTKYNEMVLGVTASYKGRNVNYCCYVLVDNDASMVVGRELWGFPKKMGRITLEEKDGKVTGTVERLGVTLVKATMVLGQATGPSQAAPLPVVNLKLIPSVKKGAPPDVKQLTLTVAENVKTHKAYRSNATLEFGGSPLDPLNKVPILGVLGARYSNYDQTLTGGEVIHDYLKPE